MQERFAYRSFAELEQGLRALPPPPPDFGRLALIVCRRAPGVHEALPAVHLSVEEGVPGDEWNRRTPRRLDAQLTVMRHDVAMLVANGQPLTEPGDNLIVELDISSANLPPGTRLRVGGALVEVTPMPHTGCNKFAQRFGEDARQFVNAPATRHFNLRGICCRVIEAGEAVVGARIEVISRPEQQVK